MRMSFIGRQPTSILLPRRDGREITLLSLANHTSGLPPSDRMFSRFAPYPVERMHAFLSSTQLTSAPGDSYRYSNLGAALLGQALAARAGKTYEELVVDRVCGPLRMASTRVTMTDADRSRFAV